MARGQGNELLLFLYGPNRSYKSLLRVLTGFLPQLGANPPWCTRLPQDTNTKVSLQRHKLLTSFKDSTSATAMSAHSGQLSVTDSYRCSNENNSYLGFTVTMAISRNSGHHITSTATIRHYLSTFSSHITRPRPPLQHHPTRPRPPAASVGERAAPAVSQPGKAPAVGAA